MELKYPNQVYAIKRKDKTLAVDAQLFTPTEGEQVSPLEIHSGLSRFVFTIVDKSNGKTITPTANIPATEIAYLKEKTKLAMSLLLKEDTKETPSDDNSFSNSPAYTVKLSDKKFKGQTPAEILLASESNKAELERIRGWLKDNLARYPGNAAQIQAIEQAITLYEIGELVKSENAQTDNSPIELYATEYKFKRTQDENGRNLIYKISVMCTPGNRYPFAINISNCYAPVESGTNGQKRVKMSEAVNVTKSSLLVTEKEWYSLIDRVATTLKLFEDMHFKDMFEIAQKNSFHHK